MPQKTVILTFPKTAIKQPITSHIVKNYDVEVTIMNAYITPAADGRMLAVFDGSEVAMKKAFKYLRDNKVKIVMSAKNLIRDEERCVHCSACVGQCFSDALSADPESFRVLYDEKRCIACEFCIDACSYGALESVRDHWKRTGAV